MRIGTDSAWSLYSQCPAIGLLHNKPAGVFVDRLKRSVHSPCDPQSSAVKEAQPWGAPRDKADREQFPDAGQEGHSRDEQKRWFPGPERRGVPTKQKAGALRDVKEEEEVSLFSQRQKCHALHRPIKCAFEGGVISHLPGESSP